MSMFTCMQWRHTYIPALPFRQEFLDLRLFLDYPEGLEVREVHGFPIPQYVHACIQ